MATKKLIGIGLILCLFSCEQSTQPIKDLTSNKSKAQQDTIHLNDTTIIRMNLDYEQYEIFYENKSIGYAVKKEDRERILPKVLVNYPVDEKDPDSKKEFGKLLYEHRCIGCHNSSEYMNGGNLDSIIKMDEPAMLKIKSNNFLFIKNDSHHWFMSFFSKIERESIKLLLK